MRRSYMTGRTRGKFLAGALLSLALSTACTDSPTSADSNAKKAGELRISPNRPALAMNTASDQLANDISGFGGAFVRDGVLNVYLTQDANNEQGHAAARVAINALLAGGNRPQMPIVFQPAKHSLKQLRSWENMLRKVYRQTGVRTAQVDERNNRFEITVESGRCGCCTKCSSLAGNSQ